MISRDRARAFPRPFQLVLGVFFNVSLWASIGYGLFAMIKGYLIRELDGVHALIEQTWGKRALIALGIAIVSAIAAMVHSVTVSCPLCHGTPFHSKKCRKNKGAISFPLIGYRASAILTLITIGKFVCMYCGTAFRWKR